jgi:hypothetical protein
MATIVAVSLAALTIFVALSVQKVLNVVTLLDGAVNNHRFEIQQSSRNLHRPRTQRQRGYNDQVRLQGHHIIIDN